jgi:hypothetical protein
MQERPKYITSMLGHPASRTVLCTKCGAFIVDSPDWRLIHDSVHEQFDELVDWAQHVSKLFEEGKNGGSPSTKL